MSTPLSRRNFFALAGGAALLTPVARLLGQGEADRVGADQGGARPPGALARPTSDGTTRIFDPGSGSLGYKPVVTPNNITLPWKLVDGVKVFHLIPEPVTHEFAPGLVTECWGYNGRVHGPTLEAVEGDRVRIYVTNRLPAPTTVHWHAVLVPNGMDGVGGLTQVPIQPGETFKYEFTLKSHGTFMYHPHHDEMTQMQLGMMGLFVVHPKNPSGPPPDRDYAFLLNEWKIEVGARRPDPNEMTDFNIFSFNGRCYPGTEPMVAQTGERVRMRIGNLSTMSHHSIHLHGFHFEVTGTDAGEIPASARWPETTLFVPVGTSRTVEFVADAPGDWVMHCHMLHHAMNQMGHGSGNLVGMDTAGLNQKIRPLVPGYMTMGTTGMGEMGDMGMAMPKDSVPMLGGSGPWGPIEMGGMFTMLKVRDRLNGDPGWYEAPPSSRSVAATAAELKRDGIG